ncbi:hypothetical protein [Winogradskyella forsetii]|uniref:hypothetical protein n=1 Tax=Winogradskyella forsetii TaxID=2686077 RepID=UPI0015C101C1|nr:hypothetical protein [Winogradskyella forsetii]
MKIKLNNQIIEFDKIELNIQERNIDNIFKNNKKTLRYKLDKAINNPKNCYHRIAVKQKEKYAEYLNMNFGEFLLKLKENGNDDYILYLNKYGDKKYCFFKIEKHLSEKGIYCFIVDDEILYVGRSKKTFKERINEYGKITAYNCLKDGQATNCNIISKINDYNQVFIGFYLMSKASNEQIIELEKLIIRNQLENTELWNIQRN